MLNLKNKRVLLTGGSGFLGGFVHQKLLDKNAEVIIPRSARYDLREKPAIAELLDRVKPEIIIHLAAVVGGIGANRKQPGKFFYDNAIMGLQLMEQARLFGVEKFVAIGTICSYPKFTPVPFNEANLWDGYPEETNAPYGLAKKMMLVQSQAYRDQYGFNSIFLLPVNLYGPNDNFDLETSHVIPAIIRKCVTAQTQGDKQVRLWGDGSPTREFLHVSDAANGIVMATEHYNSPLPINLGSGVEISIKDLAELIADDTGFDGTFIWDSDEPNGQPRRCLDVTRARDEFNFLSRISLQDGIKETVNWWMRAEELNTGKEDISESTKSIRNNTII